MSVRGWMIAMAAAGLGGLTACGTGAGAEQGEAGGEASTTPTARAATVKVASLGGEEALTDGAGRTLYLFTKDTDDKTNCVDACLAAWPALSGPATAGAGVDAAKLGTITRPEGTRQATYAGRPLYYFAKDMKAGDVNGQGVKKVWYLVGADGEAIRP